MLLIKLRGRLRRQHLTVTVIDEDDSFRDCTFQPPYFQMTVSVTFSTCFRAYCVHLYHILSAELHLLLLLWWCCVVLYYIFGLFLLENNRINYITAGLLPDDPNVIVGRNLHMTCQLYSDQYNAKDLRFKFHLFRSSGRREMRAPASDIYFVNASVVALNRTNMRPRFDRATVVCYHRNRPTHVQAQQIIKVGREWFSFVVWAVFKRDFYTQVVLRRRCTFIALEHLVKVLHLFCLSVFCFYTCHLIQTWLLFFKTNPGNQETKNRRAENSIKVLISDWEVLIQKHVLYVKYADQNHL